MPTGTVKFFKKDQGWGFIKADDGGPDVFVHARHIERSGLVGLSQGNRVSYELAVNRTGKEEATSLRFV